MRTILKNLLNATWKTLIALTVQIYLYNKKSKSKKLRHMLFNEVTNEL